MLLFHRYKILADCGFKVELERHDKNSLTIGVKFPDDLKYNPKWLYLNLSYDESAKVFWAGSDLSLASPSFKYDHHHYSKELIRRFSEILFHEIRYNFHDFYFGVMMNHPFFKQND